MPTQNVPWYTIPTTARSIFDLPAIQGMSNPYAALPSGQQYAAQAAQSAQQYGNQWGNLPNMGRDFYSAYAPSTVGGKPFSTAYNAQLNAMVNPMLQQMKRAANTVAIAGTRAPGRSYNARGLPSLQSQLYQQAMDSIAAGAAERGNTAYGRVRGEEATRAQLAQSGAELAAQQAQAVQAAKLAAYQLQAQEAYQRAQSQLAQQQMFLPYMAQAANQPSEKMRLIQENQAALAYEQARKQAAYQEWINYQNQQALAARWATPISRTEGLMGAGQTSIEQMTDALIAMGLRRPYSTPTPEPRKFAKGEETTYGYDKYGNPTTSYGYKY